MLTLKTMMAVMKAERSWGVPSGGACFGVTDPGRLRPPTTPTDLAMPPIFPEGAVREVVPEGDPYGSSLSFSSNHHRKAEEPKKRGPAAMKAKNSKG